MFYKKLDSSANNDSYCINSKVQNTKLTEIEKNNAVAEKKLEISNDIILYDLIKNEKNKLKRVNGE